VPPWLRAFIAEITAARPLKHPLPFRSIRSSLP